MIDDIRYLIVFAKIVEVGSITKGAEQLSISVTTASQHLAKLEKNLNCALIYRNTRKFSLTEDGYKILDIAREMLTLYEKGVIEFKHRSISTQKSLRISIPAALINTVFTDYLNNFINKYPEICLNIFCDDKRVDIISDGIDIAFRIGELPDSGLKSKHLFQLPRKVIASPDFLAKFPKISHPSELADMPWIGLTMRPNQRNFIHKNTNENVEVKYDPLVFVDNVELTYRLAKLGTGLAAPPTYLTDIGIQQNEVVYVLPDWEIDPLRVYAVWPSNISTSSAAYSLINLIYNGYNT